MSAFTLYNFPFNKNSTFTFSGKHHLYLGVMDGNCPCFYKGGIYRMTINCMQQILLEFL